MTLRRLGRDREGLEPIRLFGAMALGGTGTGLRDPARLDDFLTRMRTSVIDSLASDGRLHGLRAEALFRATSVALGKVQLLVDEDAGDVYFDDSKGIVVPPDFRVVDREGEQLLVEVKTVPPKRALKTYEMRERDVAARERYAEMTSVPLSFAFYWAGWNQWTLVPSDSLERVGARRRISFGQAMKANEMFRLGDAQIMSSPPITLTLELEPLGAVPEPPSTTEARIVGARMRAAGGVLEDELESNIAWTLLRYGTWEVEEEQRSRESGPGWHIDFVARPRLEEARELAERQGFIGIGTLSSIYSSVFHEATLNGEKVIEQLGHEPAPGMIGSLIPDDYWDRPSRRLPLWRMDVQPASRPGSSSCGGGAPRRPWRS